MQAHEDQPALGAQPAEEVQHEADVAVLGVELRLVEQVDQRHRRVRALAAGRPARALRKRAHLVGLVVVDRQPVALALPHAVDVLAARRRTRPAVGRLVPVISSNSVVLPEPLGPITPTICGCSTREVGLAA